MRVLSLALLVGSLLIAGCSSTPVQNIPRTVVTTTKTVEQVEEAIIGAAKARGWSVTDKKPGEIQLTIHARQHSATVAVAYDKEGYSINYVSSENLNYSSGSIHKKYNRWVRTLDKDIRQRL